MLLVAGHSVQHHSEPSPCDTDCHALQTRGETNPCLDIRWAGIYILQDTSIISGHPYSWVQKGTTPPGAGMCCRSIPTAHTSTYLQGWGRESELLSKREATERGRESELLSMRETRERGRERDSIFHIL